MIENFRECNISCMLQNKTLNGVDGKDIHDYKKKLPKVMNQGKSQLKQI